MDKYFNKFPSIFYDGTKCVDISRRVKISESIRNAPNIFYPLLLKAGIRPDSLADAYYQDPELDWLLYLTNEIVDPYYQWYLNELEFQNFIIEKYGSLELPQKKIRFYRNNWPGDFTELAPSYYLNNIPYTSKQYYTPNFGPGARVMSYSRKKENWTVATNKILQYNIDYVHGNTFTDGEIIDITVGDTTSIGSGEIVMSNTTSLMIQHISGNTIANSSWVKTIIGQDSNTYATSNLMTITYEVIANAEARFWSPVTYFDIEVEANESRKHLQIMSKDFALEASEILRKSLKT